MKAIRLHQELLQLHKELDFLADARCSVEKRTTRVRLLMVEEAEHLSNEEREELENLISGYGGRRFHRRRAVNPLAELPTDSTPQ